MSASLKRFAGIVHLPAVYRIRRSGPDSAIGPTAGQFRRSNGHFKCAATFQGRAKFPLISDDAVYILYPNFRVSIRLLTPLHPGALIAINVMQFALICKDRLTGSISD